MIGSGATSASDLGTELRGLGVQARVVVDQVDVLAAAAGPTELDWSRLQADSAHRSSDTLVTRLRAGEPSDLVFRLKAFAGMTVPMGDAPPHLMDAAYTVQDRCNALATGLLPIWRRSSASTDF